MLCDWIKRMTRKQSNPNNRVSMDGKIEHTVNSINAEDTRGEFRRLAGPTSEGERLALFTVVAEGKLRVVKPAGTNQKTETIQHNLGYVPMPLIYILDGSSVSDPHFATPYLQFNTAGTELFLKADLEDVTDTEMTLRIITPNVSGGFYNSEVDLTFRYFFLQLDINPG